MFVTSAPITADAATTKIVGVNKTITLVKGTVTGLSKAEKKVVKVSKNSKTKKVTVKGLKAGKVSFKIGKKAYTVKVGATKINNHGAITLNAGEAKAVNFKVANGSKDTIKFSSDNAAVATVTSKATASTKAKTTVTAVAAGTATITAKSANTGKKGTMVVTVVADSTTAAPATQDPSVTPDPNATQEPNATQNPNATTAPTATGAATTAPTTTPVATATPATGSAVVSLAAVQAGYKTIVVTGSALSEKVTDYTVKKGSATYPVNNVKLSADKKSATLTLATDITNGSYTVSTATETVEFAGQAEKITSVEITSKTLVLQDALGTATTAEVGYKLLNQFGERTVSSAINPSSTLGRATIATSCSRAADGVIRITTANATDFTVGGKAVIVLVETTTGLTTTSEVSVGLQSSVKSVDVLGVYKTNGTTPVKVDSIDTSVTAANYAILLTAYDQYGNKFNTGFTARNITITPSGDTGLSFGTITTCTVDGVSYVAIPLASGESFAKGIANYTIVSNTSGLLATVSLPVKEKVSIAKLTLNPTDTVYVGTKSYVEFTAKDTNGDVVTSYDKLNAAFSAGDITFNARGFAFEKQTDGSAKLAYTPATQSFVSAAEDATQPLVITTTCNGSSIEIANFTVGRAKIAKQLIGFDADVALATIANTNGKVAFTLENFVVNDQYGHVLTDAEVAALGVNICVKTYTANGSTGFSNSSNVTVGTVTTATLGTDATATDTLDTTSATVLSMNAATTAGSFGLEFALYDGSAAVANSGFTTTIKSYGIDDVSSFEVADVAQIYTGTFASDGTYNSGRTTQALTVTGKVGSTVVSLDKADFTIVGSAHIAANNTTGSVEGGVAAVYKDSTKSEFGTANEEIEVIINNKKGTSIKKSVAVSSIAPAVASVTRTSEAFAVTSNTVANTAVNATALLTLKDQYGQVVTNVSTSPRILYTNIPDALSVTNNNTISASLSGSTAGTYDVDVTLVYNDNVSYTGTLSVTISAVATLSLGSPLGTLTNSEGGSATIALNTTNVSDNAEVTYIWYSDLEHETTLDNAAELGLSASTTTPITSGSGGSGSGVATVTADVGTTAGTYYLGITVAGVTEFVTISVGA